MIRKYSVLMGRVEGNSRFHPHVVVGYDQGKLVTVNLTSESKVKGKRVYRLYKNPKVSYAVNELYIKPLGEYQLPEGKWVVSGKDKKILDRIYFSNVGKPLKVHK